MVGKALPEHRIREKFLGPEIFFGVRENFSESDFWGNLRMPQYRGFEPPRRSRPQHWNPGGARCLSSASVAQMLAAASIKVMDALFGFPARNDAEWTKRELLGRTWRRDWGMHNFHHFPNRKMFRVSGSGSCFPNLMLRESQQQSVNDRDTLAPEVDRITMV